MCLSTYVNGKTVDNPKRPGRAVLKPKMPKISEENRKEKLTI